MNKDELTKQLKQPFTDKALGGIQKLDLIELQNFFSSSLPLHPNYQRQTSLRITFRS